MTDYIPRALIRQIRFWQRNGKTVEAPPLWLLNLFKAWRRVERGHWRTPTKNVPDIFYHCCVHKTASKWIANVLTHDKIVERVGLLPLNYRALMPGHVDERKLTERTFPEGFPKKILVPNFYIGYEAFRQIPQPRTYRAVFVTRDPRDITVSWYFSMKESHPRMGRVPEVRKRLKKIGKKEGIKFSINHLHRMGIYSSIKEWKSKGEEDKNVKIFSFKDLTGESQKEKFNELFRFSGLEIPKKIVTNVVEEMRFEKKTGREKGEVNTKSHLRKGETGDWKNHFDKEIKKYFDKKFGNS